MKRYYLHQKEDTNASFIAGIAVIHESPRIVFASYAHIYEPLRFIKNLKSNSQKLQRYHLTKERSLPIKTNIKDYLVLGINEVAKMICFTELRGAEWFAEHKDELLEPRSFYLNWNKDKEFDVEWA